MKKLKLIQESNSGLKLNTKEYYLLGDSKTTLCICNASGAVLTLHRPVIIFGSRIFHFNEQATVTITGYTDRLPKTGINYVQVTFARLNS